MNPFRWFNRSKADDSLPSNALFQTLFKNIGFNVPVIDVANSIDAVNKGYLYNNVIYSVVNRIVNACAGVPWNYYVETTKGAKAKFNRAIINKDFDTAMSLKNSSFEIDYSSEISQLLSKPNTYERINDLITNAIAFYEITGNAYLYGIRRENAAANVLELHTMPAHLVEIVFGTYFNPVKGYILDGYFYDEIPAKNVMHIKNFNPDYSTYGKWLYGISPIQASRKLITLSNSAIDTQIGSFQNFGARGILTGAPNTNWGQNDVDRVKQIWDSKKGGDSRNDIIVAGEAMQWTPIGLSPVDMGIIESNKLTLRDICAIYNVPSQLLGDSEHATYSNIKEARKALITDAALPVMEKIKDGINRFILSDSDTGIIDYDLNAFIELQDDMSQMASTLSQMWWLTGNEKRIASGKQPMDIQVMNEVLIPMSGIPASEYGDSLNITNDPNDMTL